MWYGIADLRPFEQYALFGVLFIAVLGLLYALFLRNQVLREDTGTPAMLKVWTAIKEGANAYLKRQLKTKLSCLSMLYASSLSAAAAARFSCASTKAINLLRVCFTSSREAAIESSVFCSASII